jgi:hypothetical protein
MMPRPDLTDEQFEEKFTQVQLRLGQFHHGAYEDVDDFQIESAVYNELRRDQHEDVDVLALRIKAHLSRVE